SRRILRGKSSTILLIFALASFILANATGGPLQLPGRIAFAVIMLLGGGARALEAFQGINTGEWDRRERFRWMRFVELTVRLLYVVAVTYVLLTLVFPELYLPVVVRYLVTTAIASAAVVGAALALALLLALGVLLWLPILIARTIARERRRRQYRYPVRRS
ncbi:MAG TPA: hypothetical protein VGR57_02930, partial [Ktedonobacterales bacterium]|nr:hypothetical protein [Ktedonobacterales bacterium]